MLAFVLVASVSSVARAASISGTVYADVDGDGHFSSGDRLLAGVVVGFENSRFATTGADGRYTLDVPSAGIVWASAPDGFQPGPVFANVTAEGGAADLGLRPSHPPPGPLRFVQASDS